MSSPARLRLPALDGLRGILALIVCIGHAGQAFLRQSEGQSGDDQPAGLMLFGGLSFVLSRLAVLCFFVLSGFMIRLSIQQNLQRHGTFNARDYFLSRAIRVLPPVLAAIGVTWLLVLAVHALGWDASPEYSPLRTDPLDQLLALATAGTFGDLTGGLNRPLWTLAYEIQLYVLAGLGTLATHPTVPAPTRMLNTGFVVAYLALVINAAVFGPVRADDNALHVVCAIGFGLGWLGHARLPPFATPAKVHPLVLSGGMLLLAGVVAVALSPVNWPTDLLPGLILAELAALVGQTVLILRLADHALPSGVLATRWAKLGDFSYTLYVIHHPLLGAVALGYGAYGPHHGIWHAFGMVWLATAGTVGVAWLLARLVERPATLRAWLVRTS